MSYRSKDSGRYISQIPLRHHVFVPLMQNTHHDLRPLVLAQRPPSSQTPPAGLRETLVTHGIETTGVSVGCCYCRWKVVVERASHDMGSEVAENWSDGLKCNRLTRTLMKTCVVACGASAGTGWRAEDPKTCSLGTRDLVCRECACH